jgi:hypothetical protein
VFAPASIKDKQISLRRHGCGNPWAVDSGQSPELDRAGRNGRTGMPCTDDRVGLAFFYQINCTADRTVLFLPERINRAIGHLHDLRAMDDLDPPIGCN